MSLSVAMRSLRLHRRVDGRAYGARKSPCRPFPALARSRRVRQLEPGAATHVERLAVAIGGPPYKLLTPDQDTQEVDLDRAHIFACMLYAAGHPESAQFWWRFAAGAGNSASAFCLHLLHHGRGETAEAEHWRDILLNVVDLDDDPDVEKTFVTAVASFAAYTRRHRPPTPVTPILDAEVRRLATRNDADDRLVCRPDAGLARRLQDCARSH